MLREFGAAERFRHQFGESGIRALDAPVPIDDGDRHRRRVEYPREAHLGGAQVFGRLFAGGAIENERARSAGQSILAESDAMQEPDRQTLAVAALQIHVELLGDHFARRTAQARKQHRAAARREIAEFHAAGADLGQIVIEPMGERCVHVGHGARRVAGEKAGRCVIEKVDGMLQFLEDVFVPLALARDIGHGPQRRAFAATIVEGTDPDAVPADLAIAAQRRGDPQFLGIALALARRFGKPVDRFRDVRRARKEPLYRLQLARVGGAGESRVVFVGVKNLAVAVADEKTLGPAVTDKFGEIVAQRPPGELQESDGVPEKPENSDHREQRQKADDERTGGFLRQNRECRDRHHKARGEKQNQPRAAGSFGAIEGKPLVSHQAHFCRKPRQMAPAQRVKPFAKMMRKVILRPPSFDTGISRRGDGFRARLSSTATALIRQNGALVRAMQSRYSSPPAEPARMPLARPSPPGLPGHPTLSCRPTCRKTRRAP